MSRLNPKLKMVKSQVPLKEKHQSKQMEEKADFSVEKVCDLVRKEAVEDETLFHIFHSVIYHDYNLEIPIVMRLYNHLLQSEAYNEQFTRNAMASIIRRLFVKWEVTTSAYKYEFDPRIWFHPFNKTVNMPVLLQEFILWACLEKKNDGKKKYVIVKFYDRAGAQLSSVFLERLINDLCNSGIFVVANTEYFSASQIKSPYAASTESGLDFFEATRTVSSISKQSQQMDVDKSLDNIMDVIGKMKQELSHERPHYFLFLPYPSKNDESVLKKAFVFCGVNKRFTKVTKNIYWTTPYPSKAEMNECLMNELGHDRYMLLKSGM